MNYYSLTDQLLVERIIENDPLAISHLLHQRCMGLFKYIQSTICKDNFLEINDLSNELYLFLQEENWKKLREFEFRSKLITWLSVVAIRYFRKKYKSLMIDSTRKESLINMENTLSTNPMEGFIDKIDILDAIQKMSNPIHKQVLYLIEIEGYESEEVALKLNTTASNIYNIKSRAKKELYSMLTQERNHE